MKKRYYVDFNTGAGNEYVDTLEEAKEIADEGCNYTQEDIDIIDTETHEIVATRHWYGVSIDNDIENDVFGEGEVEKCIRFGDYGYYAPWQKE